MPSPPRRHRASFAALLALVSLLFVLAPRDVAAGWPPPESATPDTLKLPENWPNDPDYGYVAGDAKTRKTGQWELYSFIPDRSPGAPPLSPGETSSGMAVDMAWRLTTGDDRVLIAVLDSGIEWENSDLLQKAHLNRRELATHLPLQADGSPCAPLDPAAPTVDHFDCNGDGILTIADYADTPYLVPEADGGHPKGDYNRNGVLDAGDLIGMRDAGGSKIFSDGIDDDGNGYVDDISGWDFMKNDNDPYDDTRYGHGTGEAKDSTAATNNAIGMAGICPVCRFVPLRVGDSFIADGQLFAAATVYAADNGASVIQEALGTINMSAFAQGALDYAWKKGAVVVASMADENARHANVPATANHTMPVHAIAMLGTDPQSTTATSFVGFNTCSNYGAHNLLSTTGDPCSSEATGNLAGLSGLVYSMGRKVSLTPPLSAGEVLQLFQMTADDIDVAASRAPGSPIAWSQPGFDQRFGYGRTNANAAVEWVRDGKIPPDVDIVRPHWYDVLYPEQLTAPVPIMGTVSAKRATSYDYVVEWAPGVQPLAQDFKTISELKNVPSSVVSGAEAPLAQFDVRSIDVTHPRDRDSPHGENDFTITVRVRAVAHYGGSIGDVPGELRRAYYVHKDPDLVSGFPIFLGSSGESSPKLADLDGDGVREIVVGTSDGKLHVYSMKTGKPVELDGFPFKAKPLDGLDGDATRPDHRAAPGYSAADGVDTDPAREAIVASPAIGDVDGDGKPDIVFTTYSGTIYAVGADGAALSGFPVRLPDVPSCQPDRTPPDGAAQCMSESSIIDRGAFASPVLADLDGDGTLDVVQAAFDGFVYVISGKGLPLAGWPIAIHASDAKETNRILSTPAVTDFNRDGVPDILVGSNEKLGGGAGGGAFHLIDGKTQKEMKNWPIRMISFHIFPLVSEGVGNSPIAADLDGDGVPEAIMHGNASAPLIVPTDPGAQVNFSAPPKSMPEHPDPNDPSETARGLWPTGIFGADSKAVTPDVMFPLFAQPAAGDLDQDGIPDITTSGTSLSAAQSLLVKGGDANKLSQMLLAMWSGKTGAMLPGSPVVIEDFTFFNNQAIADISGDGYPETLTGSGGYYVHAADACGREPAGWPKFTGQWIIATTAVGDLDGDESLEVVVNSRSGWLYAWHTEGSTKGTISWESYHHDNRNTGSLTTPLEQGTLRGAAAPLEVDDEGKCVIAETDGGVPPTNATLSAEGGGCGCAVPGSRSGRLAWALALAPLAAAARRRRRVRGRRGAEGRT
ncbi:MAG: S8 family serine peptidase [Sorangiineae bacterium]|nr:S8 family serine peptidase [Polyangiaceae bacterium]MEB2323078.1 S8 family serine peptidase [Sorangiineae bacterium]